MRYRLLLLLSALTLAGCDLFGDDDPETRLATGVYVGNQGNFSQSNGSLTTYDPATQRVTTAALSGLPVVQSLVREDDRLFVVLNNGGRVAEYDARTLEWTRDYTDLPSPRYLAIAGDKAFVTSLYTDNTTYTGGIVSVLDLSTGQKVRDVAVGDNPEGVAVSGERVYVANSGFGYGSTVSVLDARTNTVVNTIDVDCDGPRMALADDEGDVWIFCTGRTDYDASYNVVGRTNGAVRVLDGGTGEIVARYALGSQLGATAFGQDASFSADADLIHAVLEGNVVVRFDTRRNSGPETVGTFAGDPIGGLAYDAGRRELYLARVPGFASGGSVTIHSANGAERHRFATGVGPTFVLLTTD